MAGDRDSGEALNVDLVNRVALRCVTGADRLWLVCLFLERGEENEPRGPWSEPATKPPRPPRPSWPVSGQKLPLSQQLMLGSQHHRWATDVKLQNKARICF
jgi:hypothetical protein